MNNLLTIYVFLLCFSCATETKTIVQTEEVFIPFSSFISKSKLNLPKDKRLMIESCSKTRIQIIEILGNGEGIWDKNNKSLELSLVGITNISLKEQKTTLNVSVNWSKEQVKNKICLDVEFIFSDTKGLEQDKITIPVEIVVTGSKSTDGIRYKKQVEVASTNQE